MVMALMSPRRTALYQTLAFSAMETSPRTTAPLAMKAEGWTEGERRRWAGGFIEFVKNQRPTQVILITIFQEQRIDRISLNP